jgi:hypothetical protein
MDLKILMVILLYYGILSSFLILGGSAITGVSGGANLTGSDLTSNETQYSGGVFGSGISFARFAGLITIGVGLPNESPAWFVTLFFMWQSIFLIFSVGWFISSIWNG